MVYKKQNYTKKCISAHRLLYFNVYQIQRCKKVNAKQKSEKMDDKQFDYYMFKYYCICSYYMQYPGVNILLGSTLPRA